jgi:hypothetical protein
MLGYRLGINDHIKAGSANKSVTRQLPDHLGAGLCRSPDHVRVDFIKGAE